MQGRALSDSHAAAEKSSEAGLLVEPMEKPTGGRFTSLGLKTGGAPVACTWRPMDKCAAAGGSPMRLDGPRTDRAALGGIQVAGSFGRMRMRTARGAIEELASRRSEVEEAAWASDQNIKDLDRIAPPMGVYLSFMH